MRMTHARPKAEDWERTVCELEGHGRGRVVCEAEDGRRGVCEQRA